MVVPANGNGWSRASIRDRQRSRQPSPNRSSGSSCSPIIREPQSNLADQRATAAMGPRGTLELGIDGVDGHDRAERRRALRSDRKRGIAAVGRSPDPRPARAPRLARDPLECVVSVERLLVGERGRGVSVGRAVAAEVKADRANPRAAKNRCATSAMPRPPMPSFR
jgi:hypothetical protein